LLEEIRKKFPDNAKIVYLDKNVLITAYEGSDAQLRERVQAISKHPEFQVILSEETLIEIAQTKSINGAIALANFATSLAPHWSRPFNELHRDEISNFARRNFFQKAAIPLTTFFRDLSELRNLQDFFLDSKIPRTPDLFVRSAHNSPVLSSLQTEQGNHAVILRFLAQLSAKALAKNKEFKDEIDSKHFRSILAAELKEADSYCLANRSKMYRACPSLNCERHLSCYRSSNPNRVPRRSDSVDLTSSIAVFPYVNIFVTFDAYLANGLKYVKTQCPSIKTSIVGREDFLMDKALASYTS
jgi:hypothetical protein